MESFQKYVIVVRLFQNLSFEQAGYACQQPLKTTVFRTFGSRLRAEKPQEPPQNQPGSRETPGVCRALRVKPQKSPARRFFTPQTPIEPRVRACLLIVVFMTILTKSHENLQVQQAASILTFNLHHNEVSNLWNLVNLSLTVSLP
jgi:hypothetical protein